MKRIMRLLLIAALIVGMCVSGFELWKINSTYTDEEQLRDQMAEYRPELSQSNEGTENIAYGSQDSSNENASPDDSSEKDTDLEETADETFVATEKIVNQNIVDLQNDVNSDIVGWITIDGTLIDYPFVQTDDNSYYLDKNIKKEKAAAGTIFMDCRCAEDFSDFNTVLYGHHMKNKSMFGNVKLFADPEFFASHTTGTLYTKYGTYDLEIFAYMVVRSDDDMIYNLSPDQDSFYEYVRENARQYREPSDEGKVVTLSTCAYEFDGARMVLLAVCKPT